ncbi:hypothetical protein HOC32_05725 [Candidatus Woesearchaeota archaeon]|jgi:hypothetical protein|nr:hypothetical protein [Candidatus Woesearchaeota archaeon]
MNISKKQKRANKRALAFFEKVEPFSTYFSFPYTVVELCAGNGNVGKLFSEKAEVVFVDQRKVRGLDRVVSTMDQPTIFIQDIRDYELPDKSAVVAVHACGYLTDIIIEKSVINRSPLAVIPCCYPTKSWSYDLKSPPDPRLLNYPKREDYIDTVRTRFLIERGYDVTVTTIDKKITPMNTILIGIPN